MGDEEVSFEQIDEIGRVIVESIRELESLEIYKEQESTIHACYKTDRSSNIQDFQKFLDYQEGDELRDTKCLSCHYKGTKYSFNRIAASTEDYVSFIFISNEPVGDSKNGMIVIVDASGVIFIATCKLDALRKFNLDIMSILYPDT